VVPGGDRPFAMDQLTCLALDFGGTKLAAARVAAASGQILDQRQQAAPGNSIEARQAMLVMARQLLTRGPADAVGISFGGPVSSDRCQVLASFQVGGWEGLRLPDWFSQELGLPAWMDNDANAAALGEWQFGAGMGIDNFLYIQVSTGIGAGLVMGGCLQRGQGLAGEFGHLTVALDGPPCDCGKCGCVEAYASGWALALAGRKALATAPPASRLREGCRGDPQRLTAETVLEASRDGDPQACKIVQVAFSALGGGIANAICLLDPQVVVIGGGIARAWSTLYPVAARAIADHLPPVLRGRAELRPSALGGHETLLGAALLAARQGDNEPFTRET
jgi:glucokinase